MQSSVLGDHIWWVREAYKAYDENPYLKGPIMDTKLDEIYTVVLPAMANSNVTDTPQNRLDFLTGMREAWLEDGTVSFEKWLWLMTIGNEILRLRDVVAGK